MLQISARIQNPKNQPDTELFEAAEENYGDEKY